MILVLAGTQEAREIAGLLVKRGQHVVTSLAGATRVPRLLEGEMRIGGFGGDAGFRDWLQLHKPTHIIDATHPFAARVSKRSARIAAGLRIPFVQVLRPEWEAKTGDRWIHVDRPEEAGQHVRSGARVFLATGRSTLEDYACLSECHLICRQIDAPTKPFPFPKGEFLMGRPPFETEDEIALFRELRVDWLIVKNAGGAASTAKLEAARALGLPVLMVKRPALLDCARVETPLDALRWFMSQNSPDMGA